MSQTLRERRSSRPLDIVIWGATGFTGRLVAEYFARNVPLSEVKWAIAGREGKKLEDVRQSLINVEQSCKDVEVIMARLSDTVSIDQMVEKTKVVLATAGPFLKHGTPIVESCVRLGTDYCDITAETPWIQKLIYRFHEDARNKGVLVVNCCGFDSIPSDLGTFMIADHMKREMGVNCEKVKYFIHDSFGGGSQGAMASAIETYKQPKRVRKDMADPYYLTPYSVKRLPNQKDQMLMGYDMDVKSWTAPWIMAVCNTRIVRRSAALLHNRGYSSNFQYSEAMSFKSLFAAAFVTVAMLLFYLILAFPPTRWMIEKVLPHIEKGPSKSLRDKGHWSVDLIGYSEAQGSQKPLKVKAKLHSKHDPGYDDTSRLAAEAALCLATQRDQLPYSDEGGVITPAAAFGNLMIDRMKKVGIECYLEEEGKPRSR